LLHKLAICRRSVWLSAFVALLGLSCTDTANEITSPDAIAMNPARVSIEVGASLHVTATMQPETSTALTWASSNESVATVDQSGVVTGVAAGSATITVSADGKHGASDFTFTAPAPAPLPEGSAVMLAAGDIATCTNDFDEATAKVLDANPTGTVATLGDNAYVNGSTSEYANCYGPTWGRHFARTRPSVGNHEYQTAGAAGYYAYFGARAGDPAKGYYSYDLGAWHIIVLNSNIARDASSAQLQWLRADLQANSGKTCTLAYWHHPRFSSGEHGDDAAQGPFWDALYQYNADVILNGHDHDYERFAPQTPAAAADNARGIRAFVVGTGGAEFRALGTLRANSQVFDAKSAGVLKLTLSSSGYSWQFLPIAGHSFTDSGSASCH
jgi:Big-like domain-containing protein/calcineurin-like phosphoesterase family protein